MRFGLRNLEELCRSIDVEGQRGFVCFYVERAVGTLYQRHTTVAAYREAAADGNVQVVQVGDEHLLDAAKLQVVLDGAESAEDDACCYWRAFCWFTLPTPPTRVTS